MMQIFMWDYSVAWTALLEIVVRDLDLTKGLQGVLDFMVTCEA